MKLSEHDEQCMVMDWWAKQYPKYYGYLFSNNITGNFAGNARQRMTQMAKAKAAGLRPGTSDLFLAIPSGEYHGFFIEMKRTGSTKSAVKPNQIEFINDMREMGYKADWYAGFDSAKKAIEDYIEKGI